MRSLVACLSLLGTFLLSPFATSDASAAQADTGQPLKITRITPAGEDVSAGRQIVIQFDRAVVPLGRMERSADEVPIDITPSVECQWRWLNRSALACQLGEKEALPPSHRYRMVVRPGITAEDGGTISASYKHEFITQRPLVRHAWFRTWKAPGMPVIRLTFNQSVSKDSVAAHLFLLPNEQPGKRYALEVAPDPEDRQPPRFFKVPGESYYLDFGKQEPRKSDDDPRMVGSEEARRVWLIHPMQELPLGTPVSLHVEPGLVSALGPEQGVTNRQVVKFHTFPAFRFLGVRCQDLHGTGIFITDENAKDAAMKCEPFKGVALSFSAPVLKSEIKQHVEFTPDLAGGRKDYDPWASAYHRSYLRSPHRKDRTYDVTLPEVLKAAQAYRLASTQDTLKDEFGRTLAAGITFSFFTDHRSPNYQLVHTTSVLEMEESTEVPLYVTNLDKVNLKYRSLTPEGAKTNQTRTVPAPVAQDISYAIPLGVRRALEGETGVVYGTLDSLPHVSKPDYQRTLFAQVTPYAVQVKIGHFNTLVWVTDLDSGEPVANASIRVYKDSLSSLTADPTPLSEGVTDAQGIVYLKGTETLDPFLKTFRLNWRDDHSPRLFVRVDEGQDMALVPLDTGRFLISTYRVSGYTVYERQKKIHGHIHTWGTTAQGVYRAGDTIQYKVYVRDQNTDRLLAAPRETYTLKVIDPKGKTVHTVKSLTLSDFGGYHGEFIVPETGAVGWYQFKLSAGFTKYTWQPMRVLVSDFTPSPFRVTNELNGDVFQPGDAVDVSTQARLHSGGPYTDAGARVTATLKPKRFASQHPLAKAFTFGSGNTNRRSVTLFQKVEPLNDKGDLTSAFTITRKDVLYGTLVVESAVQDDRGKYVAASSRADFVGVNRFIGLKNSKWLYKEDEHADVHYLVVDERGKPVAGTAVSIEIERKVTKASRVKGAGNAYLTQFVHEWVAAGNCSGTSKNAPGVCTFTPSDPGSHRITARITDTKGAVHSTQLHAWVVGKGRVVWSESDDNSLEIIPEADTYRVGDTARYLVKNPFPGAKALVTLERYGVVKHWVRTLKGSTPIIEFPVKPDYLPGFYLSILVFSPRVEKPLGEGHVDLGKPTFRMGYLKVPVKDPYKEIEVNVGVAKETYKPRETVKASLQARPRHPGKGEPIELAVAVLDEAVFDLLSGGRQYFDPYEGFYRLEGLDLQNFNLLMGLVGRQKFEKKGANPGGDGGPDLSMRSLFKFVSYWNPSLPTDKAGRAEIEFEVPDNLTGWRVLVMAVTPTDRMGLGEGTFTVNRPTEVRPVMPNQVTEGDRFKAGFSVMNRSDQSRELSVRIEADGDINRKLMQAQHSQTISLPPYKRTTVWMDVQTSPIKKGREVTAGEVRFKVTAGDKMDRDGLLHSFPVHKRRSLETAATYGSTTADRVEESLLFPQHIHTDVGNVSVVASPTVIGNVRGAFEYMRDYPYICWEQVLSKGVMAAHYKNLRGYLPEEFKWNNSDRMTERMLERASSYQAPNGGMVYYIPQDQYVSPYLSAYTALAFNWLRTGGHRIPEQVEEKLHKYLVDYLKRDISPSFYSKGMSSTVRAVALAALAEHGKVNENDIARYRQHATFMSLFGKAHFLQAALKTDAPGGHVREVLNMILGHANESGGKLLFNEELDDSYLRILATPLRANCAILTAFTRAASHKDSAEVIGDTPFKLVRTITQSRGNRDHWENTQENMFCMNALIDYSRAYEQTSPKMTVRAMMDGAKMGEKTFTDFRDDPVRFERVISQDDPGRKSTVIITRRGTGRVYYSARIRYAPSEEHGKRINAGIDLRREYSVERGGTWVLVDNPMKIKRGELVRVDIFLSLPTARHFVVVDDPVPGGLEPVNRDLATASTVDADKGTYKASGGSWWFHFSDWYAFNASRWSFYHQEIRHDSVRFYSDYLAPGNYHVSYTAQAIASGSFAQMPVHAEEMYDPDIFGKGIPSTLRVEDK